MPRKNQVDDWDRLFAPNARRRGGPLAALANTLIAVVIIALLSVGFVYGKRYYDEQMAVRLAAATSVAATSTKVAETTFAQWTATAEVRNATATAEALPPTPEPVVGTVISGGNLRSEPRIVPETVIGLIFPGDEIVFLAQHEVAGQRWYRIRVINPVNRSGVPAGTEGWASASLLSQPEGPLPTPGPEGGRVGDRY